MNRAPRRWLQIHLSTAIAVMFVVSILTGLNMRPTHAIGGQGGLGLFSPSHVKVYGWPFHAFQQEHWLNFAWPDKDFDQFCKRLKKERDSDVVLARFLERQSTIGVPSVRWYWPEVFYDTCIAGALVLGVAVSCEWLNPRPKSALIPSCNPSDRS